MRDLNQRTLLKLGDTQLSLAEPAHDVRGRKVIDSNGEEIGEVLDLLIDDTEKRVRFLLVRSGGILGVGAQRILIPVDAVTRVGNQKVYIDRNRQHVAASPAYDPEVVDRNYIDRLYTHYGYAPFWAAGYLYPVFPFYP
jgi:sporulation protein YlmC with PRC-barrel domain